MSPLITFCKRSIQQIQHISKVSNNKYIIIGVKSGGCNGLRYYINPTNDPPLKFDEKIKVGGVDVILCGKSLLYILGTEVIWKTDFMGERFDFINPNAKGSCGCGETFNI